MPSQSLARSNPVSPEPQESPPTAGPDASGGPSSLADAGGDARFRVLVEQIRDFAIFLVTPDGRPASWNSGVRKVLGYDAGEFLEQPLERLFTPEDIATGVPRWELETARTRGRASDDRWMVRKDGVRFWASGVTTSLWDGGRLLGFGKVLRDLSEQKALQQRVEAGEIAMRQNDERLRLALSAARGRPRSFVSLATSGLWRATHGTRRIRTPHEGR